MNRDTGFFFFFCFNFILRLALNGQRVGGGRGDVELVHDDLNNRSENLN